MPTEKAEPDGPAAAQDLFTSNALRKLFGRQHSKLSAVQPKPHEHFARLPDPAAGFRRLQIHLP